ncbi:sulfide-dependent adenosine diphosphate thiazole synthase [Thermodesulfobacteriota bacterium]
MEPIDDILVSKAIISSYMEELLSCLDVDVAIAGGGPSGLVAAYTLSQAGHRVALFESKLSPGGGMWGGGIMFNKIVVQEASLHILDEMGIRYRGFEAGTFVVDSVEATACLIAKAVQAGARIFNCIRAEDVYIKGDQVTGLVLNWTAVTMADLHVDPITMRSRFVIDATGHPLEVVRILVEKNKVKLNTPSGGIEAERSMWADRAEASILENTREIYTGLYVAGMAANAAYGDYRMGPIFGGMLLSGEHAAKEISGRLQA